MKLIVSSTALAGAVKNLCRVINPKNALPILGDILCDADEGGRLLTLTASDGEAWLSQTVALEEAEGGGRFCVPATRLMEAVGELTEQPVTILATTESDNTFRMQHATGEAFFPIDNADEYPATREVEDAVTQWLTVCTMAEGLNACQWATASDGLRPIMCGVYFNFQTDFADITASDGHVLMRHRSENSNPNITGSFIMPKKMARLLPSLLATEDRDDDVQLTFSDRTAQVEGTLWTLTFLLIEGRYPNYDSVIPKDQPYRADIVKGSLVSAVRKVSPFASDASQLLRCLFERERLTLTGEDYDFQAGATDRIYSDCNVIEPLAVGLKASSLAAMLQKIPYGEIRIRMTDPSRAVTIEQKPEEDKEPKSTGILGLLMPMLLNE